jgi:hypothetical protein
VSNRAAKPSSGAGASGPAPPSNNAGVLRFYTEDAPGLKMYAALHSYSNLICLLRSLVCSFGWRCLIDSQWSHDCLGIELVIHWFRRSPSHLGQVNIKISDSHKARHQPMSRRTCMS